nr:PREDICTED: uncharacterized protein LOC105671143 [Linepithema humile]
MSEVIVTEKNVWQYYERVSNYEAKCRLCRQNYVYVYSTFRLHITAKIHDDITTYEETCKGRQEWPWTCYKYNDTFSQCLFCRKNFQSDFQSLASHLHHKHVNEVKNYVLHDWIYKYCTKVGDFKVQCTECIQKLHITLHQNLNIHIVSKHSEELRNAQETRDIVLSSKSVMNLKTIEVKENMWEYYTKLSSFEAKCKYCTYKVKYIFIKHLSMHVKKWHKSLSEWEQADENQKPWIYFKYSYEYTFDKNILHSECLMCGEFFLTTLESTKTHLSQHSEELHDFIRDHWCPII